jgi:hypothetical protein
MPVRPLWLTLFKVARVAYGIHAMLDIVECLDGPVDEELGVVAVGLVEEIRRRRIEAVGIPTLCVNMK